MTGDSKSSFSQERQVIENENRSNFMEEQQGRVKIHLEFVFVQKDSCREVELTDMEKYGIDTHFDLIIVKWGGIVPKFNENRL